MEMLRGSEDAAARHGRAFEANDIAGEDLRWGFDAGFPVSVTLPDENRLIRKGCVLRHWLNPSVCRRATLAAISVWDASCSRSRASIRTARSIQYRLTFKSITDQAAVLLRRAMRYLTRGARKATSQPAECY
jgi:hypothetical protein